LDPLLQREWPRDDGARLAVGLCLIDTGYRPDPVAQAIRSTARAAQLMASRGQGIGPTRKPMANYAPEPGVKAGRHWRRAIAPATKLLTLLVDTNYWKSFVRDRLATPQGDPGALTLFGAETRLHHALADQLTAERPTEGSGPWGTVEDWRQIPNRENHWWDCLVGSACAACYLGAKLPEWDAQPQSRPRIRFSERRKPT
jgi:phage terminase large subunit GpA-like protein